MPVTDITKDIENRTLTITAEFAAPLDRVWALYADPRQLEKVWGPPEYPATFVDHDLRPGGRMTYFMTSPDGERFAGYWDVDEVAEPGGFAFRDGFADADLNPDPALPVSTNHYAFSATAGGGTRAVYTSRFDSAEDLQKVLDMGAEEGARTAINQIDGFLASSPQPA
ncbi:MAG TPA: SRPBCC domain-containing protein [Ornithinibacter sp.]|nr:SRPBCC domain-containing protein [Ornithinibacter sp.]